MANDLNQVFLIGRLTRDPEFKTINSYSLVNFSLACGRSYNASNGDKREESHFFDCEAWGKLAEIISKYTQKGKQIAVQGRLKQDTWDTPDGKKASRIRIVVENIQLIGGRMGDSNQSQQKSEPPPTPASLPQSNAEMTSGYDDSDDVPF